MKHSALPVQHASHEDMIARTTRPAIPSAILTATARFAIRRSTSASSIDNAEDAFETLRTISFHWRNSVQLYFTTSTLPNLMVGSAPLNRSVARSKLETARVVLCLAPTPTMGHGVGNRQVDGPPKLLTTTTFRYHHRLPTKLPTTTTRTPIQTGEGSRGMRSVGRSISFSMMTDH